jgi:CDP-diacylglycerol pyrophosphatase
VGFAPWPLKKHSGFDTAMKCLWIVAWLIMGAAQAVADPSALWNIEHDRCIPHQQSGNDPKPCSLADLDAGYVILKDLIGATQFLLMPTVRTGGIEDPAILAPEAPNYWEQAWRARRFTEERAGKPLPREALSLAINSAYGRTQDQLHIHIDCVRADVRDVLAAHRDAIGSAWTAFPVPIADRPWRAIRVDGVVLGSVNPFRLLAEGITASGMARHTLVVVGMNYPEPGFVVLDGEADLLTGNRGSGEDLQDHDCALAH